MKKILLLIALVVLGFAFLITWESEFEARDWALIVALVLLGSFGVWMLLLRGKKNSNDQR